VIRKNCLGAVLLAGMVAVGVSSCTSDSTSTTSGSPSVLSTPGPEVKGIEVKDSTITVTGDKVGELKATINNTTKDAVTLRAVACSCAGMVQLGTDPGGGEITPISTGVAIAAGASGELGGANIVRLTRLTDSTVAGATVTFTGYFGEAGVADFSATVN
jgi:hypothetical protein